MTSRSTSWAPSLGWTLVPGLVLVASILLALATNVSLAPWAILPSLIVTYLFGVRVKAWWWAAGVGLAAAPAAALGGVMVVHATASVTGQQVLGSWIAYAIMMGSVVTGAAVVTGVLHALAAIAGLWHGTRREGLPLVPVAIAAGVPARAAAGEDNAR